MNIDQRILQEMILKHEKSLSAFDLMINLIEETLDTKEVNNEGLPLVAAGFLTKFHKTALSMKTLCLLGFEEDARVLLRVLLENLLTLSYITRKPGERLKQYANYHIIERMKSIKALKTHYPNVYNEMDENQIHNIENEYSRVKDDYHKKDKWSGKSLREMAEEIGGTAPYWYDTVYSLECMYVHSSVITFEKIFIDSPDNTVMKIGPYPFTATDIFSKATEFAKEILSEFMNICEFEDANQVTETWNQCKSLLQTEFNELRKEDFKNT